MAHFACVKFPDFSFKGNISEKERASERKNEGDLSFFLSLALSWNRLRKYQPHRWLVYVQLSKKEKFHGIKLQKYGNIGRQTCQTLQTYSQL